MAVQPTATWICGCLLLSTLMTIVTIFLYTRRKVQAALCLVNIAVILAWYILLAVLPQGVNEVRILQWYDALPAVCVILIFMARKGILADEKLVRSLDRIR